MNAFKGLNAPDVFRSMLSFRRLRWLSHLVDLRWGLLSHRDGGGATGENRRIESWRIFGSRKFRKKTQPQISEFPSFRDFWWSTETFDIRCSGGKKWNGKVVVKSVFLTHFMFLEKVGVSPCMFWGIFVICRRTYRFKVGVSEFLEAGDSRSLSLR